MSEGVLKVATEKSSLFELDFIRQLWNFTILALPCQDC